MYYLSSALEVSVNLIFTATLVNSVFFYGNAAGLSHMLQVRDGAQIIWLQTQCLKRAAFLLIGKQYGQQQKTCDIHGRTVTSDC